MNSDNLTLAFSPCPNDTFIFEAIINQRIDTEGLSFNYVLEDVEYLNKAAFNNTFDICKLSFNAFSNLTSSYKLLNSGSALGNGCGPLLITKNPNSIKEIEKLSIAIPGVNTTAFFLLQYAIGKKINYVEMNFSQIEDAVLSGIVDAGLIIHENRFTYESKGLNKVMDLGEYWEQTTNYPIPLGCIAIKQSLNIETQRKVDRVIHKSIEFAFKHPNLGLDFIKKHAQEMGEFVMKSHIDLYVNQFSQNLGKRGIEAVDYFLKMANPHFKTIPQSEWLVM